MSSIGALNGIGMKPAVMPLVRGGAQPIAIKGRDASTAMPLHGPTHTAAEAKQKFTEFVGEAFYGQMFKAMRSTVGKPAYFHGGRAEEAFQGQLDQTMSQELTKSTATKFADPMFERQFPGLASQLKNDASGLDQLAALSRR
jgi:hypothetical protein